MGDRNSGRLDTLSPEEKRALLARLYAAQVQKPKVAPLSLAQERILSLCQLEPDSVAYTITTAYRLQGPLDTAALESALNQIVRRHAVLRTCFATVDGQPAQVIAHDLALRLVAQELAAWEEQLPALILGQGQQPFDLGQAPLLRASLFTLGPEDHVLALTTHRLVFDGQCWPVLITELIAFYEASCSATPAALPELALQYADFARWQREWLKGAALETQLAYWREKLSGRVRLLRLPTDHPRTAAQFRAGLHTFRLSAEVSDALRSLSRQEGVSLFVTLLAAVQVLFYRYTSQEDFIVFSSVAGRNRPELKGLIGLFANLLALRTDLSGDPTFRELLERVRAIAAGAYAHQDVPFEQILESVQVERDQRYASPFQLMFVFWPEPLPALEWPGMVISPIEINTKPADFDLLLHITHTQPEMSGMLRYKADLFDSRTIARLLERFQRLLAGIVAAPQRRVADLTRLTVAAEQGPLSGSLPLLPSQWSYLRTPELWVNMVEVVELRQRPDPALLKCAVDHILEHHDALRTHFTYEGQWRQHILACGDMAPFSCIDLSEQPGDHLATIKAALSSMQSQLLPLKGALIRVVLFDLGMHRPAYLVFCVHHVIFDNASLPILLEDLHTAYGQLMRGEPVQLPAKTTSIRAWAERLDGYLRSAEFQARLDLELALLQAADAALPVDYAEGRRRNTLGSIAQVQVSLSAEETSILFKEFPRVYKVWLIDILLTALMQSLTHWSGAPQAIVGLVDAGRNLELPGVEEADLSRTTGCLFVPGIVMIERPASADPIEAMCAVQEQLRRFPTYGISVGMAQQVEHYPAARQLAPAELRLNYLGQLAFPDLAGWSPHTSTALEDFVANRRHAEIDRNPVLLNCTAVILAGRLLVSWEYSPHVHRQATVERVANDFVEALRALVRADQLLREQNVQAVAAQSAYVAPRTPTEELLAGIWAAALGHERVGMHDNFFELGGDSITGLRIISRANQSGLELTPKKLFENQTVAELAAAMESTTDEPEAEQPAGPLPLMPAQHWFFEQLPADPHGLSQSLLLEARERIDPGLLEAALQSLLLHHDALRLRFTQTVSGWQQHSAGASEAAPLMRLDLSALPEHDQDPASECLARQLAARLNIAAGPLVQAALFELGTQKPTRLLIVVHRLIVDPVSWRVLLEDLCLAYRQLSQRQPLRLPHRTTAFARWAEQLIERARSEQIQQELDYWLDVSRRHSASLPVERARTEHSAAAVQTVSVALDVEATQSLLRDVPKAYQTRTDEVLLAAVAQTLGQWTGQPTLLLDVEGYGREEPADLNVSRTLGWLTPVFPALLDLRAAAGPGESLVAVKEQLRRTPHKGVNYGVLRYLCGDRDITSRLTALHQPEIMFNCLGQLEDLLTAPALAGAAFAFHASGRSAAGPQRYALEISASLSAGQLRLSWRHNPQMHSQALVESLADACIQALRALIAHCRSHEAGTYTPSDFGGFGWDEAYFQDIAAEIHRVIR